jgi:hypothetical protein
MNDPLTAEHETYPHLYKRGPYPNTMGQTMSCRCGAFGFDEGKGGSMCPSAMIERIAELTAERDAARLEGAEAMKLAAYAAVRHIYLESTGYAMDGANAAYAAVCALDPAAIVSHQEVEGG